MVKFDEVASTCVTLVGRGLAFGDEVPDGVAAACGEAQHNGIENQQAFVTAIAVSAAIVVLAVVVSVAIPAVAVVVAVSVLV